MHTIHTLRRFGAQGVTSPLMGQMFFRASLFGAFGASKRWLATNPDGSARPLQRSDFYKAGAMTVSAARAKGGGAGEEFSAVLWGAKGCKLCACMQPSLERTYGLVHCSPCACTRACTHTLTCAHT